MSIPASWFDELRSRLTLSTIVQQTVALRKAGREWKACCPFHQEKSPSFTVNDEKGFYHCFGCSAHGDVIRWMTEQRGLAFMDAVKELAALAGMEMPARDPKAEEKDKAIGRLIDVNQKASEHFQGDLRINGAACREYLASRCINDAAIAKFGLGYASGTKRIADALAGVKLDDLITVGLVRRNPDGPETRDMFRRRLIIPIHDTRGRCIGFGGRIIGQGEPKYLNSPDTPVFDKGRTLFNYHRAAPSARSSGRLLIVEGYLDVVGVDSAGMEAVVAPNGTALTEGQILLAWKLVDEPTLCFDGDRAGRKAAARAAMRALPIMTPGKTLKFAFPPNDKDPDDVAREGGLAAIESMIDGRKSLLEILWRDLLTNNDANDPDGLAKIRAAARDHVRTIKDPDVRKAYGDGFKQLLDARASRSQHNSGPPMERQGLGTALQDAVIVGICLYPEIGDQMLEKIGLMRWARQEHAKIVDLLVEEVESNAIVTAETFAQVLDVHQVAHFVRDTRKRLQLRLKWLDSTGDEARAALCEAIETMARSQKI